MPERAIDRRRGEAGLPPAPDEPVRQSSADPILALQRAAGNRAVADLLARAPAEKGATGSVEIPGVGSIPVSGGNLAEWAGTGAPDTVELTSQPGRHSKKLEKLAGDRTATDVKVSIVPPQEEGEHLNVGGSIVLDIQAARVKGYAVEDGTERWRLTGFTNVKRTKTTRKVS